MQGNFRRPPIRPPFGFRVLPCLRRPLMRCMVLPPLVGPLVPGIRHPPQGSLLELSAVLAAVTLAPVLSPANAEPPATAAAIQLEDHELVHPARKDENWTTASV